LAAIFSYADDEEVEEVELLVVAGRSNPNIVWAIVSEIASPAELSMIPERSGEMVRL
jgi:hypothetical protein